MRRAFASGDQSAGWAQWQRHLSRRKEPVEPFRLLPGKSDPLLWALPEGIDDSVTLQWVRRAEHLRLDRQPMDATLERALLQWLSESVGGAGSLGFALQSLACSRALPGLAAILPSELWWTLLDHLLMVVIDAEAIQLDDQPLVHQLVRGELALTLAYLLPELAPCRALKRKAREALSDGLVELLDGEGLLHAGHFRLLRPLLACWTRCRALGARMKGGTWKNSADEQYQWLVRQALRLTRHDGTQVFSNGSAGDWGAELFAAALQFGGDEDDREIARLVLPRRESAGKRKTVGVGLPEPALHSEWAAAAVLRPQWSRSGERLTVLYAGRSLRIELACGKDVVCLGDWEYEVRFDGAPAAPSSDWEQLCWLSDDDADFLELQIELGVGLRMQRQMVLAREDHFLLLADVILADGPGKIEYRGCLPLCPGVGFRGAKQTREGYLGRSKRRAVVLPLALPEWRSDQRIGELVATDKGLELRQSAQGRSLYAPLFVDLDRRRHRQPLTWRQLTVAEALAVQPAEVAAGYRVAVGRQQWLMYRSLAEKGNRTLLGHNLSTEMLVARFEPSGEVDSLLEVQ